MNIITCTVGLRATLADPQIALIRKITVGLWVESKKTARNIPLFVSDPQKNLETPPSARPQPAHIRTASTRTRANMQVEAAGKFSRCLPAGYSFPFMEERNCTTVVFLSYF
jgi:hypothetical protein